MNGEDLRFLADRAGTLEDKTAGRLLDVHQRIARARRRRMVAAASVAASILVVVMLGLVVLNAAPDRGSPDPAPTPNPSPGDSAVLPPERGTCWAVPPESGIEDVYQRGASPKVPCTQEHTSETTTVFSLAAPTVEAAQDLQVSDMCREYVEGYLGITASGAIPWGSVVFLPSEDEAAAGASWARCDVVFPSRMDFGPLRATTGSADGVAADPPADLWTCLDQPPSTVDQPMVPCDQPHAYEQTGNLARFTELTEYPTKAERDEHARTQCFTDVPAPRGLELVVRWDPASDFAASGGEVVGWCFVHDPGSAPLPPR